MPSLHTAPIASATDNRRADQEEDKSKDARNLKISQSAGCETDEIMTDPDDLQEKPQTSRDADSDDDNGNDEGEDLPATTTDTATTEASPPADTGKKVTPSDDEKPAQQKKVQQLSLSLFFMPGKGNTTTPSSTRSSSKRAASGKSGAAKKKNGIGKTDSTEASPIKPRRTDDPVNGGNEEDEATAGEKKLAATEKQRITVDTEQTDRLVDLTKTEERPDSARASNKTEAVVGLAAVVKQAARAESITNAFDVFSKSETATSTAGTTSKITSAPQKSTSSISNHSSSSHKKKSKTTTQSAPIPVSVDSLSDEKRTLYEKYQSMKEQYLERATEMVRCNRNGLSEEKFERAAHLQAEKLDDNELDGFPTVVATNMAVLLEGSELPLSGLVPTISVELARVHGNKWSFDFVGEKVKVLAERKAHFDDPTQSKSAAVDVFEDTNLDRFWRWEVTTLDLLPSDAVVTFRKARIARKKIASHHSALLKLAKSLQDTLDKILDPRLPKLENVMAKVSQNEERVLKFEREAEKLRLLEEAKARKAQEQEEKRLAKEAAAEEKRQQKEVAAEKKKEAAKAREEAKRKKDEEKEQQEADKKLAEEKKRKLVGIQQSSFKSFFSVPKKAKVADQKQSEPPTKSADAADKNSSARFDWEAFRAQIDAGGSAGGCVALGKAPAKGKGALKSRKRRTNRVAVSVLTTVQPKDDDGWDVPAYSEKKTIEVPNKYIFLSFHEDCRPPYHGTWTKQSSIVTGRTPFRKAATFFAYAYDSEAEWEEGDDEVGEDVEDEEKDKEEEADDPVARMYDYEDGFCVADDQFLENEEEADDETKALYKKKLQLKDGDEQQLHVNRIQIIAPGHGGIPLSGKMAASCVEGFDPVRVPAILSTYQVHTLSHPKPCLNAFPQVVKDVDRSQAKAAATDGGATSNKDEYTAKEMATFVRFTHHNTLGSKDKLVEELRTSHPTIFGNRSKATRKLDAIAEKKKHPHATGVHFWEVKSEILEELGLSDVLQQKVEGIAGTGETGTIGKSENKRKADATSPSETPAKKKEKTPSNSKAKGSETETKKSQGSSPVKAQPSIMAFLKKSPASQPTKLNEPDAAESSPSANSLADSKP